MKPFKCGLVVGKFCPLHKGHQYLIDKACEQCEKIVLISYSNPESKGYEPTRREKWLEQLYPQARIFVASDESLSSISSKPKFASMPRNDASDDVHRQFCAWLCFDVLNEDCDAIFTSEDYGHGFAKVLSEYCSRTVKHILVDLERTKIPVSGTQIRRDPTTYKSFIDPRVYETLTRRAVFLGGESTGKSTLAKDVSNHLDAPCVDEYGRELWIERNGKLDFADLLLIGEVQVQHEVEATKKAPEWLICDTSPLTTKLYSEFMFGRVDTALEALSYRPYDVTFLCAPDFGFVQDGLRQDNEFRMRQDKWYRKTLSERQIPYIELKGSIANRRRTVLNTLAEF